MKYLFALLFISQLSWAQEYPEEFDDPLYETEDYFYQDDDYADPYQEDLDSDPFFYEIDLYEDDPYEEEFSDPWEESSY